MVEAARETPEKNKVSELCTKDNSHLTSEIKTGG